jgi:hypothetical protein
MTINLAKAAAQLARLGPAIEKAGAILEQALFLIDFVEDAYEGLSGAEKLAAVKAGLKTFAEQLDPELDDRFAALWVEIAPFISTVVAIFKLKGLFTRAAKAA